MDRERQIDRAWLIGLMVAGLVWRLWLGTRYHGWDMEDLESAEWARLVLKEGWRGLPIEFGPLYYVLQAMLMATLRNGWVAGRIVSTGGAVAAIGLAFTIGRRWFSRPVGVLAAGLLVFQTHFSLLAATTLREPFYAALLLGVVWAAGSRRFRLGAVLASLAFLTRQEGLTGAMVGLVACFPVEDDRERGRLIQALWIMGATLFVWSVYTMALHNEWWWTPIIDSNIRGDEGVLARGGLSLAAAAQQLYLSHLPWKVGHLILVGLLLAPWAPMKRRGRAGRRAVWMVFLTSALTWSGTVLLAELSPSHDLHWKRHTAWEPLLLLLGVAGIVGLARRIAGRGADWPWRLQGRARLRSVAALGLIAGLLGHQAFLYNWRTRVLMRRSAIGLGWIERAHLWLDENVPDELVIATRPLYWYGSRHPDSRYVDIGAASILGSLMHLMEAEQMSLAVISEETLIHGEYLQPQEMPDEGPRRWGHGHLRTLVRLGPRPYVWVVRYEYDPEDQLPLVRPAAWWVDGEVPKLRDPDDDSESE